MAKQESGTPVMMNDDAAVAAQFHGYCGDPSWPLPRCAVKSDTLARPHYSPIDASEYEDAPAVVASKAELLTSMISASKAFAVYTGAGLSTAAGIGDYASKAKGSLVKKESCGNRLDLVPTYSHRVLVSLERAGHLHHWLQQNHDGLAQKAGFPFEKINEIHGSWFDPKQNPVVLMDGDLRHDLHEWLLHWEQKADLVLAIGTSLCGMNADRMAISCAERHKKSKVGQGLVVVNLQRTPHDHDAALRVFCRCDLFFKVLATKMGLKVSLKELSTGYPTQEAYKNKKAQLRALGIRTR